MKGVIFLSLLAFSLNSLAHSPPKTPLTVVAPAGTIIGQTGRLNSTVHEFLGIPFAKPPIGTLRFEPPVRKPPSYEPINARKFGLSCPSFDILKFFNATMPLFNLSTPDAEGEDCLSLNIWTRPSFKNVPVLIFIYGGAFYLGTTRTSLYDGTHFAAHNDVVMVTINYRTNVFGFPNSPGVNTENLGLLDQRMAVEWVKDNIAAFGGNPNQITIFGQSAGGISVDFWSYAYPKNPIVKGLIEMSGTAILGTIIGGGDTYNAWNNLTDITGCSVGTAKKQLACLKKLDWKIIRSALPTIYQRTALSCNAASADGAFFGPRADGKLVFSPDEYGRKGSAGEFAKLPLLIGSTDQEIPPSDSPMSQLLSGCPNNSTITPEIQAEISTAVAFTCPARTEARFRAAHKVPVWRYRYFGSLDFKNDILNSFGAGHGAELILVFGFAAQVVPNLPPRVAGVLREIQQAWATFAKDPEAGLSRAPFYWNKFTADVHAKSLVRLAYKQETKASMGTNTPFDDWCDKL